MSKSESAQHVIVAPRGGWSVRRSGAQRASRTFASQDAAIRYARQLAERERTELFVHRRDGTVASSDNFADAIEDNASAAAD